MSVENLNFLEALVAKLTEANLAYRNGNPVMSDAEYGALEDQLRLLAPKYPFLHHITGEDYGTEAASAA